MGGINHQKRVVYYCYTHISLENYHRVAPHPFGQAQQGSAPTSRETVPAEPQLHGAPGGSWANLRNEERGDGRMK